MDVSERTVRVSEPRARPEIRYQEVSSSSRANEMNMDERDSKRPRPEEAGRRRGGVDVEMRSSKISKLVNVAGDAAAAAPELMQNEDESMNSFVLSKTEVFEKIEESLRQCKGVEDINDDESMELCTLWKGGVECPQQYSIHRGSCHKQ